MKGERRHELQQNDLLTWVNELIESVKPYLTLVALVALLAVLSLFAWRYWDRQSSEEAAYAWDDLMNAMNTGGPVEVKEVAEQRPDSDVADWAAVISGDMYLDAGCQELFTSKATAAQELRKAVDQYLVVLDTSRNSPLRERATFGLARAYESLAGSRQSSGELDKAVEHYQKVVDGWPKGAYAEVAAGRIEDLARQSTKAFYDRFAQYDPQPTYDAEPIPGMDDLDLDPTSLKEGEVSDFSEVMNLGLGDPETEEPTGDDSETPSEDAEAGPDDVAPPEDADDDGDDDEDNPAPKPAADAPALE